MKPEIALKVIKECIAYKSIWGKWPDPITSKEHIRILQAFRFVRILTK